MTSLKAALSRRPLLWFFVLTLAPIALRQFIFAARLRPYLDLSVGTVAIIAALLCWAADSEARGPRHAVRRLLVFVALAAVVATAFVLLHGTSRWFVLDAALPAVLVAYAISLLWSPVFAVRNLARPLARWRAPWTSYAFALLTWPLLYALMITALRLLPARGPTDLFLTPDASAMNLIVRNVASGLIWQVPWVVGWYGYAARRLLVDHSPLAVGLLLGVLHNVFWLPDLYYGFVAVSLIGCASVVALSLVAVWLFSRWPRSYLPIIVLGATGAISPYVLSLMGTGFGGGIAAYTALVVAQCLLALGLIAAGRTWRGPTGEARDAVFRAPGNASRRLGGA